MPNVRRPLAWLAVLACSAALAADLPINVGATDCGSADAKGAPGFTYTVTWSSPSTTPVKHYVNTGNKCKLGGNACGTSNQACEVGCAGACSAKLDSCPFGIASWVQVGTADRGLISKRVAAPGPKSKCRGK